MTFLWGLLSLGVVVLAIGMIAIRQLTHLLKSTFSDIPHGLSSDLSILLFIELELVTFYFINCNKAIVLFHRYDIAGSHFKPFSNILLDGTYGNPIKPGRTLTTIPRSFILTNKPLPVGQVSYFRCHSSGIDKKLYLQVWRRLAGIKNGYRLVGQVYHCTSYNGTTQVS